MRHTRIIVTHYGGPDASVMNQIRAFLLERGIVFAKSLFG